MDMTSGYYVIFLIAVVAAIAAISQQLLGIAFIAFGAAIVAYWLSRRKRAG